jgi:hypothetical protein
MTAIRPRYVLVLYSSLEQSNVFMQISGLAALLLCFRRDRASTHAFTDSSVVYKAVGVRGGR